MRFQNKKSGKRTGHRVIKITTHFYGSLLCLYPYIFQPFRYGLKGRDAGLIFGIRSLLYEEHGKNE